MTKIHSKNRMFPLCPHCNALDNIPSIKCPRRRKDMYCLIHENDCKELIYIDPVSNELKHHPGISPCRRTINENFELLSECRFCNKKYIMYVDKISYELKSKKII